MRSPLKRRKGNHRKSLASGGGSPLEADQQEILVAQIADTLARHGRRLLAIPNERRLYGTTAQRVAQWRALERRGVSPGAPDMLIPGAPPDLPHCPGVAIELKRDRAAAWRPGQREWLLHFAALGWLAFRADGLDHALAMLARAGYR